MKSTSAHAHDTRAGRSAATIPMLLLLALGTVACSWSVPADPGLNSKQRSRSTFTQASTSQTSQQIFQEQQENSQHVQQQQVLRKKHRV